MCMGVWPVWMFVYHVHAVLLEAGRERGSPRTGVPVSAMWVLEIKSGYSGKAASAHNHKAISSPKEKFFLEMFIRWFFS